MKQCSFLCVGGWWPLILLPILFMIPLLFFKWEAIENDVASNTVQALSSNNIEWADVETMNRGRHVLITGTPPNTESIDVARQVAENTEGVDEVTVSADVVPPATPAELTLEVVNDKVILTGVLASQEEINRTLANAITQFGANNVENRLEIGNNVANLQPLSSLYRLINDNASKDKGFTANVTGNQIILNGEVATDRIKRDIGCLLYTSPSPRDKRQSRMPSSA